MKPINSDPADDFRSAVSTIEHLRTMLKLSGASSGSTEALDAIVKYLRRIDPHLILRNVPLPKTERSKRDAAAAEELQTLLRREDTLLTDIEKLVDARETPLEMLKQIAAIRFSFTRGALSRLSRESLLQKLRDAIENERTHETIGRLAVTTNPPAEPSSD